MTKEVHQLRQRSFCRGISPTDQADFLEEYPCLVACHIDVTRDALCHVDNDHPTRHSRTQSLDEPRHHRSVATAEGLDDHPT